MMVGQVPPILAIKEANSHLKALHDRNQKLEREVVKLRATLSLKLQRQTEKEDSESEDEVDYVLRNRYLEAVVNENDEFLREKDKQIACLKDEIQQLNEQLIGKAEADEKVVRLTRSLRAFKEAAKHKPALEDLLRCLEKVTETSDDGLHCSNDQKQRTKGSFVAESNSTTDVSDNNTTISYDLNNSDFFNHISKNLDSVL